MNPSVARPAEAESIETKPLRISNQRPPRATWEAEVLERLHAVTQGLSYRDISRLTSVHPETVRRYLVYGRATTFFIAMLCRALAVNLNWLLYGEGAPQQTVTRTPAARR